jgi:hypothetical protein
MFNLTKTKAKRLNLTLPPNMYDNLTYVARRMGISASSLVFNIGNDSIAHMASIMRSIPETGATDTIIKRLRGESISYIQEKYDGVMGDLGGDDNAG